jgi:hypothetical protein
MKSGNYRAIQSLPNLVSKYQDVSAQECAEFSTALGFGNDAFLEQFAFSHAPGRLSQIKASAHISHLSNSER